MRVVSLVPSITETLVAWGIEPVAVTRFCGRPGATTVGGTKDPDVAAIVALEPDLVVLNDEENRREDADALAAGGLDLHVVHVESLDDVPPAMHELRTRLGLPEVADAEEPAGPTPTPVLTAFVPIWRRPWMTMNARTYGSSLLAAAGVGNVFADDGARYPQTTLEEAAARRPDVVLAPSEPYPFGERHVPELAQVGPVALVDGDDLFWWGARTPQALGRLRRRVAEWSLLAGDRGSPAC